MRSIMLKKMIGEDETLTTRSKVDLSRLPPCRDNLVPHINRVNHRLAIYKRAATPIFWCPSPIILAKAGKRLKRTTEKALDFPIANMALCSDISALQQTVTASLALFEARLAALEKCKGLQDTVPMGEFAELTQIQHDQSHTVTFPNLNLDKRETAPAASHWLTVGAKAKQHTKVNQQAHSTPLKFTLQLKNRFQPLQEPTNATHAPLSPEMRPDGQCGQRRKNQSPRRRAVHVSATSNKGPSRKKQMNQTL
ncbi:unnamed protein product [Boreogadus saida]